MLPGLFIAQLLCSIRIIGTNAVILNQWKTRILSLTIVASNCQKRNSVLCNSEQYQLHGILCFKELQIKRTKDLFKFKKECLKKKGSPSAYMRGSMLCKERNISLSFTRVFGIKWWKPCLFKFKKEWLCHLMESSK